MDKNLAVLVLVGGQSTEHEISILSANNVIAALQPEFPKLAVGYLARDGAWYYLDNIDQYLALGPGQCVAQGATRVYPALGHPRPALVAAQAPAKFFPVDCVFPVVHGTTGEDGALQGLLELMGVAYVGADVLSSAIGMNKAMTKQVLAAHGIATAHGRLLTAADQHPQLYAELSAGLGDDLFVKPASLGSSVGVTHVKQASEFTSALQQALRFDRQVLVEERIIGREIECAVLGNDDPIASLPSEIVTHHDFYSYDAKYLDPQGASTVVPAQLSAEQTAQVRETAVKVFKALGCCGMLRVDFFLSHSGRLLVNEVNSIPGFTNISMYPKMWQASGVSYADLLQRLISLAMERHTQQVRLLRTAQLGQNADQETLSTGNERS